MKKIMALTLAVIMSFSCFSLISFAAETTETVAEAEHLTEVPEGYIGVYTIEDLYCVRNDLTANYILMNDIDLSEATAEGGEYDFEGNGWNPIGSEDVYSDSAFSGIFDGNNYSVIGMNIDIKTFPNLALESKKYCVALFACVSGTVKNITVEGTISTEKIRTYTYYDVVDFYFGGICAKASSGSFFQNCKNKVSVSVYSPHTVVDTEDRYYDGVYNYVGGIVGGGYAKIENCANYADISLRAITYHWADCFCSGITSGQNTPERCFNSGSISVVGEDVASTGEPDVYAAGISRGGATDCYNVGNVTATINTNKKIIAIACGVSCSGPKRCYNVGKVVSDGEVRALGATTLSSQKSYYLESSAEKSTGFGKSLTEEEMKLQSMYQDWDFDTVWTMEGREDYPYPELRDVPLVLPEDLMHKHEYNSEITKEATHLTEGEMTYTCACGDTYTEVIAKLDIHSYTEATTAPTCTEDGLVTYTCICGYTYTETIPSESHNEIVLPAVEATCTQDGLTEGLGCSKCNEILIEQQVIPSSGHAEIVDEAVAPTCTETGLTAGKHCDTCGEVNVAQKVIPALGHKNVLVPGKDATCTESGLAAGIKCESCGELTVPQQIIPAKEHKFSDWIVTSEVTCTADGKKIKICSCGLVEEEVISATGHTDEDADNKCDDCTATVDASVEKPAQKDNVFTFLKSFLNNLIEFFRELLGLKK